MTNLSGARVLVTGGAGLVGSHIVDELVKEGARVTVYDSLIRGKLEHLDWATANGDVRIVEADLRDRTALQDSVKGNEFVFHQAAAWLRQCQENPRLSLDVNIAGTFNLLEACVESGVKKLVAASSSSVYGEGLYLPTDEKHPFNNDLFYGASKVANEQYYRSFYKQYGLDFVAFRYLNVYGPRQPYEAAYMDVIMHFLNRIDADESPVVRGDGSATVDLVYVGDVARANIIAMKSSVTNEFFNVASGVETSLKDLAWLLIRLSGKAGKIEPRFEAMDSGLVTRRWGDPAKAREMLGFVTTTQVEEGMRRVIEWRKSREVHAGK
ncbi:MAG TPA: NAD-dependent epimerase/dehydratase family protein [Blastocatellia bacterium]|nr:NAD-dependent epimerase/dehydratase family protein [Blastocatellia bacterium]